MFSRFRKTRLDLQAKISLVLVAVILPTFLIITVAENKITQPLLEKEILQIGLTTGKALATEIKKARMLSYPKPGPVIEAAVQEFLYTQPNIARMDVLTKDPASGQPKIIASSVEGAEEEAPGDAKKVLPDEVTQEFIHAGESGNFWDIYVPIENKQKKVIGSVHVLVSLKLVGRVVNTLWKLTASAAVFSVVVLIWVLSYFLKKTIANDRLLRRAESHNIALTEQLHEIQRRLMNTEKLAVMGQLTASFAHEIGTPLNAIGGHLQLLKEELKQDGSERIRIIDGQVAKIEQIVKNFLQSTAKPASQRQLVDINQVADKALGLVAPRLDSLGIEVSRRFNREMGPLRMVPLDLEQILLNLINNSLDSMSSKRKGRPKEPLEIGLTTEREREDGREWAVVTVHDTGEGIKKQDLENVMKPFFTTKRPGEGTGLGLTICQQLANKYGGVLKIDSKEGAWTRVTLRIPYSEESG